MYINTFKYTPKDVSCQLCTEYVKKLGCTALRCPWLAERIEAGVVGYREAVLETFPHERRLFQRLNLLIRVSSNIIIVAVPHKCIWAEGVNFTLAPKSLFLFDVILETLKGYLFPLIYRIIQYI